MRIILSWQTALGCSVSSTPVWSSTTSLPSLLTASRDPDTETTQPSYNTTQHNNTTTQHTDITFHLIGLELFIDEVVDDDQAVNKQSSDKIQNKTQTEGFLSINESIIKYFDILLWKLAEIKEIFENDENDWDYK